MTEAKRTLFQISVFWRNDQPDGIGVTLTHDFGDLDLIFNTISEQWDEMYREAVYHDSTETLVRDLFVQLEQLRHVHRGAIDFQSVGILIGNIYLLEKLGRLPKNDFNGVLLAYVEGEPDPK